MRKPVCTCLLYTRFHITLALTLPQGRDTHTSWPASKRLYWCAMRKPLRLISTSLPRSDSSCIQLTYTGFSSETR